MGLTLDAGTIGVEWDAIFEGAGPCTVLRVGDLWHLYYIAADDYIPQSDNVGPAHRSLGLATSSDGIRWTKHPSSPLLTWSVTGNPEEGAVSGVGSDRRARPACP